LKSGKKFPLFLYAAIALILIWSGTGWIIYEIENILVNAETNIFNNRLDQFVMIHGVSMILIGVYIMVKNVVYKDSVIY
jgi:hypothetical protein